MIKVLIPIAFSLISAWAYGSRLQDTVHSVSPGRNGEDHLVFLNNGRVFFIKWGDPHFDISDFTPGEAVEVEVDEENTLESVSSLPEPPAPSEIEPDVFEPRADASVISSAKASEIFRGMNRSYKSDTECTDRAQVWAYEEWKKHDLYSRKVFMFFTNTYIRAYRYHWWFHVSPYVYVDDNGNTLERVMDRRYTSGPRSMKSWSDIFIRSKKACPNTTYAHYRRNKNGPEHCFHVKSAMYYRLPYHVRMLEDYGRVKTKFSISEVNFSYRAFNRRGVK